MGQWKNNHSCPRRLLPNSTQQNMKTTRESTETQCPKCHTKEYGTDTKSPDISRIGRVSNMGIKSSKRKSIHYREGSKTYRET